MADSISELERTSKQYRAALLAHDRATARLLIARYGDVWANIRQRTDALNAAIQQAKADGEAVKVSWLYQKNRLGILRLQVEEEVNDYARWGATQISGGQAVAVELAQEHARGLVDAQMPRTISKISKVFPEPVLKGFAAGAPTVMNASSDPKMLAAFNKTLSEAFKKSEYVYRGTDWGGGLATLDDLKNEKRLYSGGWTMGKRRVEGRSATASLTMSADVAGTFGGDDTLIIQFKKKAITGDLHVKTYGPGSSNTIMWEKEVIAKDVRAGLKSVERVAVMQRQGDILATKADLAADLDEATAMAKRIKDTYGVDTFVVEASEKAGVQMPASYSVAAQWTRLPSESVNDLVGFLHDGAPLSNLLAQLGPQASKAIGDALIVGVATGQGPRQVASQVRRASGMTLQRALVISRNEILRSYRTAAVRNYTNNADVLRGWRWVASLDRRTCVICWAKHGSLHPIDEPFSSHIQCRCSPAPETKTFKQLGIEGVDETRLQMESGPDRFTKLPEAQQLDILGPSRLKLYQEGAATLPDMVGRTRSRVWGPSLRVRTLDELRPPAA